MNDLTGQFIALCWAAFLLSMVVASFFVKRTVETAGWTWRISSIVIAIAAIGLLKSGQFSTLTGSSLWPRSLPIELLADAVTVVGLGILLWARFTLGGNWSADVVLKENHELIVHGPYQHARHPLYSGLLVMVLGAAIWYDSALGFVVLGAALASLFWKAREEEHLLSKQFPEAYSQYKARVKALIPFVL